LVLKRKEPFVFGSPLFSHITVGQRCHQELGDIILITETHVVYWNGIITTKNVNIFSVYSYDSILYPIAKDLKTDSQTIRLLLSIYPQSGVDQYAFKLFLDILCDVSYFPVNAEKTLENCLSDQFHAL